MTNTNPDRSPLSPVNPAKRVLIAVPTYRRGESMARLLNAIAGLETDADVCVLVADNEGTGGQGFAAVAAYRDYRFPIKVIAVPERGLANVRNAIMAYARGLPGLDYVAMVDDDERPSPIWLAALMEMQQRTHAEIVGGPTEPVFAEGAPSWARDCSLFTCGDFPSGPVPMIWGTCNVLFHCKAFDGLNGPLFDPIFNDLGGEDVDAFMRLKAAGCHFAWARDALVLDDIPLSRTTWSWVVRRAFRIGNSNMLAQLRWHYGSKGKVRAFLLAVAGFLANSVMAIGALPFRRQRIERACRVMRSAGKLAFLAGYRMPEYALPKTPATHRTPSARP